MKVIAINGSPKKEGNTYHAIQIVAAELQKEGIETEIIHVGTKPIGSCLACGYCSREKNGTCIITDDGVNQWIGKMAGAQGILLGSPVHYSGISGAAKAFLDRAFLVASANGCLFRHKVGASLVAVRRSGGLTAFNQLNHYLTYSEMIIPASCYWNVIHGAAPGEVLQDEEGVQIMRVLGKNMAWAMKLVEQGKDIVWEPEWESRVRTNFIR